MAQASAFDPKDKAMIDRQVVESFGTFEKANAMIRRSVLHGYFVAVSDAYQVAPTMAMERTLSQEEQIREIETNLQRIQSDG
eukprot:COSAG01_NODE_34908_length_540_cov_0.938776_2_plen_81_part_01